MTRDEALDVLDTIADLYPRFELTKKKSQIWLPGLMRMDFKRVMQNLEKHVTEHPYAPTLAEIAAYPAEENEALKKIREYEEQARLNPATQVQKQEFWQKLNALLSKEDEHD